MQTPIHDLIIKKLSKGIDEDDLILEICENNQVSWSEGKALLEEIKGDHDDDIASRQVVIKTVVAVATLIMGLTLLAVSTLLLIDLVAIASSFLGGDARDLESLSLLGDTNMILIQVLMQESQSAIPVVAVAWVNGLAMTLGSMLGMRETWRWLIERVSRLF